jgi:hypothetical protein
MTRHTGLLLMSVAAALVAACGSNSPITPDTPTPTPAPTAGPVTITAIVDTRTGQVAPGLDVLLSDETGAPVAQAKTDAAGQASFTLQPGAKAMVTIISQSTSSSGYGSLAPQTFMDVGPGDKIGAYVLSSGDSPSLGSLVVDFPDRPPEGTQLVTIDAGCAGQNYVFVQSQRLQGYVADLFGNCGGATTADVKITAVNGDRLLLAYSVARGVAFAPNTKTTLSFPDGWRTDLTPLSIAYKNVPAGFAQLETSIQTFNAGGYNVGAYYQSGPAAPGAAGTNTIFYSSPLVSSFFYQAILSNGDTGPVVSVSKTPVTLAASGSVDFATDVPPALNQPQLMDVNTFRPAVAWSSAGDLSKTDVGIVQLNWNVGKTFAFWSVNFPPSHASPVRLPELPDSLAYARPTGDAGTTLTRVYFYDDSLTAGYKAWIAPHPYAPPTQEDRFAFTAWYFPFQ